MRKEVEKNANITLEEAVAKAIDLTAIWQSQGTSVGNYFFHRCEPWQCKTDTLRFFPKQTQANLTIICPFNGGFEIIKWQFLRSILVQLRRDSFKEIN